MAIMEKCKDQLEREFYIKMTKKYGWTKDVLINHIENKSYEKYLLNQTNFDETLQEKFQKCIPAKEAEYTNFPESLNIEIMYLSSEKRTTFSIIKFTYFYYFSKKPFLHIYDLHFLKDLICGLCRLIYQP